VLGVRAGLAPFAFATTPRRLRPGRLLTASLGVRSLETGAIVRSGVIRCGARIGTYRLRLSTKAFRGGRAVCAWRIPAWARKRLIRGSVGVRQGALVAERSFSKRVQR
jgi:hypothetical protein